MRFGGATPKQLREIGGVTLVARALAAASGAGLPVLLVVSDDAVGAAAAPDVAIVHNEAPERGIASSLQCALRALTPRPEVSAAVVGLADQPLVGPEAYRRLAAAYDEGARLSFATYGGARGNPVLIARDYWAEALELTGDEGARVLFSRHDAIAVPCDDTGAPDDVDTPEDLANLESRWRSQTASE